MALVETTELAVKASRRPATKTGSSGGGQKGPSTSNWGRGFWRGGSGRGSGQGGGRMGNLVGADMDLVEEEEEEVEMSVLILWHVIGVGAWLFGP